MKVLLGTVILCFFVLSLSSPVVPRVPLPATLTVDNSSVIRAAIPGELYGFNVEWIERANGLADASGSFSADWSQRLQEASVDHLRWPGGTFSDYYHWKDGIGPRASRPSVSHHTDPANEVDVVGTSGIARFAASFGGGLLLTVNAGSGTAAEAADWVRYMNAPTDLRRSADGFPTPWKVTDWEIGNELYLKNNPGNPSVAKTAQQYTALVNAFAPAMRGAVPDFPIRIVAIAEASSTWYPMGDPGWLATLLKGAAKHLDLVAVHQSYHPVLYNDKEASRPVREVYQALWAAPEAVAESLDGLGKTLSAAEDAQGIASGKLGIAITEWGSLFGFDRRWIDHGKTLGSALYIARLFQVYQERDRVRVADAFKLTDSFSQGWIGFDGVAKPQWEVFSLMAKQKGFGVLKTQLAGAHDYSTPRVGSVEARGSVEELTGQATLSPGGKSLWVTIVNRSWDQPYDVTVALPPEWKQAEGRFHLLSGAEATDHNGPDVRPWIPTQYYVDPPRSGPVTLVTQVSGTDRTFSVPAHSFLAVEFTIH